MCYTSFAKPNYDPERNTPIPTILPIQGTFDKAIADSFGNAEYRGDDHWKGRFYPEKLPKTKRFEYYSKHFDTVELNNTFYQLPKDNTLVNWYANAPQGFFEFRNNSWYSDYTYDLLDRHTQLTMQRH